MHTSRDGCRTCEEWSSYLYGSNKTSPIDFLEPVGYSYPVKSSLALISILMVIGVVLFASGFSSLPGEDAPSARNASEPSDSPHDTENVSAGDQNPDGYRFDYEYSVAEETEGPTGERYVNRYEPLAPPNWRPSSNVSLEDPEYYVHEVTRYPYLRPTEEQLDRAWRLYNESYGAALERGWFDYENAKEDGYRPVMGQHHVKMKYRFDDESLNPYRPETLVYYKSEDGEGRILAGFMYETSGPDVEGEQVGGPLTVWHYHPVEMMFGGPDEIEATMDDYVDSRDDVESADEYDEIYPGYENAEEMYYDGEKSVEMIHVWFVKHPEGPFGTTMTVPREKVRPSEKMTEEEFKSVVMWKHESYLMEDTAG